MALPVECVETEPDSFEEVVQQPIWVDAMVEEYDSIVRNNVWDMLSRLENKLFVSSHWLYKVKQDVVVVWRSISQDFLLATFHGSRG